MYVLENAAVGVKDRLVSWDLDKRLYLAVGYAFYTLTNSVCLMVRKWRMVLDWEREKRRALTGKKV